jgi:hypothetical protein
MIKNNIKKNHFKLLSGHIVLLFQKSSKDRGIIIKKCKNKNLKNFKGRIINWKKKKLVYKMRLKCDNKAIKKCLRK